eukprot:TRINITY_DN456_c0_g2_i5.p1 TRINITY_DN456_c0_g2~~TRINITY_DN456_c0_g2_i5.p1  ORF type:complete len:1465 (+),score=523.51 TRINITY_DN456_c0_g2_i5:115-4509(+)
MLRRAVCGAVLAACAAEASTVVGGGYIAVPGGMACPRDCGELNSKELCHNGAAALGLPCDDVKSTDPIVKVAADVINYPTADQRYMKLLSDLGIATMSGAVVVSSSTGLEGTEMHTIYWDVSGSHVVKYISNKTDEAKASIITAWESAPFNIPVMVGFKRACGITEIRSVSEMGGCHWAKGAGLRWNNWTDGLLHDVQPWEQTVNGKMAVPGKGSDEFRICKCTVLPKYVAVMHAKCAPSCRRGYDACSQHPGCKRISSWDTCKDAAQQAQWHMRKGDNAGPSGASVSQLLSDWNSNFVEAAWQQNRGSNVNQAPTGLPCTPGGSNCLRTLMFRDDGATANPGAKTEWTTSGLAGGVDRYCAFMNNTAADLPSGTFDNVRWLDLSTQQYRPLATPPVNFLGDANSRVIPAQPEFTQFWQAPQSFLDGPGPDSTRAGGCTMDGRKEIGPMFYPWNMLRLQLDNKDMTDAACCPAGEECYVENCTAQPCLSTGVGGDCFNHRHIVEDSFELCECHIEPTMDECEYFGQPCGAGQTCHDPDQSVAPDQNQPGFQCTCSTNGNTATGEPANCNANIKYIAKAAGRGCGECTRVVSPQQCEVAAATLGLSDTTASLDPIAHRRTRPCGCHYNEHGEQCTSPTGDCLLFNPVYGDGMYDGCDAYEPADAHDFLICACNASVPKYVAEPAGQCRAAEGCRVIDNKQDCRAAAEFIGMHLAVHEEQEALLALGGTADASKIAHPNYTGIDGNTYSHDDDGLGPVIGDGLPNRATRPPGCHYRRRFDADILPNGATVNWPHLLFNPMLNSTVLATTQDMAICQCGGAPLAPTPAPTADNAAFALSQGLLPVGNGMCAFASGAPVVREVSFVSTFHTCASHCASVSDCRGVEWFVDAADTVDREGLGRCTPIRICSLASQPCEPLTTAPAPADTSCYDRPPPTPAPTPAPTALTHLGDVCQSFCCQQTNRADCCGDKCDLGANGSYCWWSAKNECERNCYPREGPCMDIEICFNATEISPLNDSAFGKQVAKDTNLLLGSDAGSVDLISVSYLNGTDILVVKLRCPDGGCGSKQFAVEELCFSGQDIPTFGPEATRVAVNGKCMHVPGGVLTEDAPKADLGGRQPVRVTASDCRCEPVLQDVGLTWDTNLNQWVTQQVQHTPVLVTSSTLSPAWLDSPPVNTLVNIPEAYMGLTQFRMNHSAPFGAQFNISCPPGCSLCDVFIMHYHQPPCSSDTNGGWPALLPDDGWIPASCAPRMTDGQTQWPMVAYWRRIEGGKHVVTPPVETACLKYFTIFAGPGSYCEDNSLNTEAACKKVGGLCMWRDGECRATWCPPRQTLAPGAPPGVGTETKPHTPVQCVPPPGLQCENPVGQAAREAALSQLNPAVSGGYGVLHAGKECLSDDAYLGTEDSIADCAAACARASSCKYFIYGTGPKSGLCYHELTTDACATEGFESDHYLFAQLTNVPAEQTGTF